MRSPMLSVSPESSSIKRSRIAHGITVRELAKRLDVTAGAVSQMERSEQRGGIRIGTLRRALAAMGDGDNPETRPSTPSRSRAPFDRREDRVTFELHRAVATKLIDDPQRVMSLIPGNLAKIRQHVRGDLIMGWLDRWEELSRASVGTLIDAMLSTDELGKEMRQNSPFMGVLSQRERLDAIQRAAA